MAVLYLVDQGATLHKRGGRLVVSKLGQVIQWVHAFRLEQVVIFGNVQLTPQAVAFLLEEGIDTVFLTVAGRFRGRLVSNQGSNVELRRRQFQRADDEAFVLETARSFVRGKLINCRTLLRRHQRRVQREEVTEALHRLRRALAGLEQARTLDEVRGWEGAGASAYFGAFGYLITQKGFPFRGRSRRPPRDPINALLSFGYTTLLGTVTTAAQTVGLDPFLGSLHAMRNGKPSLVLDLMEEFRPLLVDATVLRAINRREIVPEDFLYQDALELPEPLGKPDEDAPIPREEYPVLLRRETVRKWIMLYDRALKRRVIYPRQGVNLRYRDICLEQARLLARHIRGEEPYQPFVVR